MMFDRAGGLHSLVVSLQIMLALCLYAALVFCFHLGGTLVLENYGVYGFVVTAALVYEFFKRDRVSIRTVLFERSILRLHPVAFRQVTTVLVALVLFVALLKDHTLSRVFLATYLAALYPVLLFSSKHLPLWCSGQIFRGAHQHKTLLVGMTTELPRLQAWLQHRRQLGFSIIGIVTDDEITASAHGLTIFGGTEELERVIRDEDVHQVIVLGLPLVLHRHSHVVTICNRYGARLAILSDLDLQLKHPIVYTEDDGLHFLTLRPEPLENPRNRAFKRLLDIAISLVVVTCFLPFVAAVVWICHRLQSPGSLMYLQTRSGLQNQQFRIYKFRTMHCGDFDITRQALKNDGRVFPIGRWMRKLSIDELPQFLNVLRGEMSIVGPRPHLVEHNSEFAERLEHYHIRAFVRPGITGLAQVRGFRGETTPETIASRLSADITYLENWSLSLELGIIVRTAWHVLHPPKTAY